MTDQESPSDEEFQKVLEDVLQRGMSELCTPRALQNDGDLEALRSLAEGTGSCRFKVKEWTDPTSLSSTDEKSRLLHTFLLFLWQSSSLAKVPCDPLDLRVARSKKSAKDVAEGKNEENSISIFTGTTREDAPVEPLEMEDDIRTHLVEDLPEHLLGPREIDLRRKDIHHSLFVTYRKSTDLRKKYFLESKHILHVRKLSGIDIYGYGFEFNRAVLEKTAPSLEELDVGTLTDMRHLELLKDLPMPKLRRLNVWIKWIDEESSKSPFVFAQATEGHCGLRWLRARLPQAAFESLLRANGKTLLELHVDVGTPRGPNAQCRPDEARWPLSCEDLPAMLVDCGLVNLRRLVLTRGLAHHTRASCAEQARSLRRNLPSLLVECEFCKSSETTTGPIWIAEQRVEHVTDSY